MKLQDVKERIDIFFDNITADKLLEIAVLKYGFSEVIVDIEEKHFETLPVSQYGSISNAIFSFDVAKNAGECNQALAA
jgi:hypothetical protein